MFKEIKMKNKIKWIITTVLIIFIQVTILGCSNNSNSEREDTPSQVLSGVTKNNWDEMNWDENSWE